MNVINTQIRILNIGSDWKKLSDQGKLNWQTASRSQANRASENSSNQTAIVLIDEFTGIPSVIESHGDLEKIGASVFNLATLMAPTPKAKIPTAPEFKAGQVWNSQTGEVLGAKKIPTDLKTGTNPSAGKTSVTIDVPHSVVAEDISKISSANKPEPLTSPSKTSAAKETLEIEAKKKSRTFSSEDLAKYQNLLAEQAAADLQKFGTSLGLSNGLAKDLGQTAKKMTTEQITNPKEIAGVQASLGAVTTISHSNSSFRPTKQPRPAQQLKQLITNKEINSYFIKILQDPVATLGQKEIARKVLEKKKQALAESREADKELTKGLQKVFQEAKTRGIEPIKVFEEEFEALEAKKTQYLDAPYEKAIEMQKPTVQVAQDIPDEFMRPRKPIDSAFNLMNQYFNPDNPYRFNKQTKYNSVEEWKSAKRMEEEIKIDIEKTDKDDAQKARLEAETIDLSIYQGMQRQHKFQEIKQEVQTLLSELPANPRPTDLVEWIHKKYPELQIRMPSKADLVEKFFMSGIPQNTGYYTEAKKALPNMVFFIPPGSMQASIRRQQIIQKSSLPNQAKMIQHGIDGIEAAYKSMGIDPNLPAMILTKESSFTACLHEFIHFLQSKKGLVSSEIQQTFAPLESIRANAKQKVLQGLPLDWNEKNLLKEEALAEVEVGQIIAQALKGHIPDEDFAFQHPYTDLWMQVLKDK